MPQKFGGMYTGREMASDVHPEGLTIYVEETNDAGEYVSSESVTLTWKEAAAHPFWPKIRETLTKTLTGPKLAQVLMWAGILPEVPRTTAAQLRAINSALFGPK